MSLCFMLTAGKGTRLRPYTDQIIKPRIPFLTLPLCYYGFFLARQSGFNRFLLNKHHLPEQVDQVARDLKPYVDDILISDESNQLLGSAGALWKAKEILSKEDFFLVANGDEVLFTQQDDLLKKLVDKFHSSNALCTLLTCDHPDLQKSLKPVWTDSQGQVRGFGDQLDDSEHSPVHYTGYKLFSRRIFDFIPEGESNIFYQVLTEAIAKGETVNTYHLKQAAWYETGNFTSYLQASSQSAQLQLDSINKRRRFFDKCDLRLTRIDETTLTVHPEECRLNNDLNARGLVVLGDECSWQGQVHLKNSVVGSGVNLKTNQSYSNQLIL